MRRKDEQPHNMQIGITRPSDIMSEISALTHPMAASRTRLETGERLQWPMSNTRSSGANFAHQQFTRGSAFLPIDHVPPAELPDDDYPMLLSTGACVSLARGQTTRRAKGLMQVYGERVDR